MSAASLLSFVAGRYVLAVAALLVLLSASFALQPRALSYIGISLLLGMIIPIALATLAQMFVVAVGDLDLSIGQFIGMVACILATTDARAPAVTVVLLIGAVAAYALTGALIAWLRLTALVVTLGLSFVWSGLAILILPNPGGNAPEWLVDALSAATPLLPVQIWMTLIAGLLCYWLVWHTPQGLLIRAAGGNAHALRRTGWSVGWAKSLAYGMAGVLGVLSGTTLVGIATSGDPGIATRYTLMSIAAVVLGGGELSGGRISIVGALSGAYVVVLVDALLTFLGISANWQVAAQGILLLLVLALRGILPEKTHV
jgi:ribose transport system permease protein